MATAALHPFNLLVHSHRQLDELSLEIEELIGSETPFPSAEGRESLVELSVTLCDELVEHFLEEERALFPLVRERLPEQVEVVERLEAEHDTICGAVVRLTHLAEHGWKATRDAIVAFERFKRLYATHARAEIELFDTLTRALDFAERATLAARSSGLS